MGDVRNQVDLHALGFHARLHGPADTGFDAVQVRRRRGEVGFAREAEREAARSRFQRSDPVEQQAEIRNRLLYGSAVKIQKRDHCGGRKTGGRRRPEGEQEEQDEQQDLHCGELPETRQEPFLERLLIQVVTVDPPGRAEKTVAVKLRVEADVVDDQHQVPEQQVEQDKKSDGPARRRRIKKEENYKYNGGDPLRLDPEPPGQPRDGFFEFRLPFAQGDRHDEQNDTEGRSADSRVKSEALLLHFRDDPAQAARRSIQSGGIFRHGDEKAAFVQPGVVLPDGAVPVGERLQKGLIAIPVDLVHGVVDDRAVPRDFQVFPVEAQKVIVALRGKALGKLPVLPVVVDVRDHLVALAVFSVHDQVRRVAPQARVLAAELIRVFGKIGKGGKGQIADIPLKLPRLLHIVFRKAFHGAPGPVQVCDGIEQRAANRRQKDADAEKKAQPAKKASLFPALRFYIQFPTPPSNIPALLD